jgi:large subunit ribosomal protein L6
VSRIGRMPVSIPAGVQVEVKGSDVRVKGPKGELSRSFSPTIGIALESGQLAITRNSDMPPSALCTELHVHLSIT